MKRRDLVQKIEEMGCVLIRHGGKHDWYQNPLTRMAQPVPRHREIKEFSREVHLEKTFLKAERADVPNLPGDLGFMLNANGATRHP